MREERIEILLLVGHHWPAFRWRADSGPTLNAGLVALRFFQGIQTSIVKKPYKFEIVQGGGGVQTPFPLLWLRACQSIVKLGFFYHTGPNHI